ncbi:MULTISPECIES: PAAR domain-containing protein [unclassified Caballeronia]|uniref:PAAR domain-containing protein n=1 Tax=unclassified Caballeronia TaxID=2646786 RepID=UPI00285A9379|nr:MULTISPECIES: PAAR domain-containing protein [unclassified Caballeronia]MDR5738856.1 PAAR domain-containing protein [Caballeronia sp. LZ016]MDR5811276.1 PAAR domain-containing protein [Caballeronia sp. LZ019]
MKDVTGRDVARLGDKTDHGGRIIEAASELKHMGIPTALNGHLTECPKCGGTHPIIATGARQHMGVKVALIGDKTACGATIIAA